jgi:hypothetical protein
MPDSCAERLAILLAEEREALRAGALERLPDLLARKEVLAEEATRDGLGCSQKDATQLAEMARINADLMEAARTGLRAAIDRLSECSAAARSVVTYDPSGARHALPVPAPKVHRRA